ncbi:MAG TPA: DNA repair protein RadA [Steroidobacteraceae bacterium]|jgi:DNA repair protein RadA/Sms|nr:DNA repair protein RadA [Steroidobacteraceae bacterium]
MPRSKEVFICQNCGASSPKWQGQCAGCGEWNTLVAEIAAAGPRRARESYKTRPADSVSLAAEARVEQPRLSTGSTELDRVLGGGLVTGSVTLIGGDPGIGKSTLMLQAAAALDAHGPVLYATGEESLQQVAQRARRLGLGLATARLITETCVESIVAGAKALGARVLIIDSIQTMNSERVDSAPGAVSQLRECTAELVRYAKSTGTSVLLVGHVTKEGQIAGPRVLEHMVDTVLYFESDTGSRFRVLRSVKNRFGAANEIGVFAMAEQGLREVTNPSAIFLSRHEQPVPGSVITVMREGTRSLLLEVQVLADSSLGANPRRVAVGIEGNRLTMLLAIAHRHGGLALQGQDVFANVVGGVRLTETAGDLAIVLAARSSLADEPIPHSLIAFGELGLAGEIRPVPFGEERLREAAKHGFRAALVPEANVPKRPPEGMFVTGVTRLRQALDALVNLPSETASIRG